MFAKETPPGPGASPGPCRGPVLPPAGTDAGQSPGGKLRHPPDIPSTPPALCTTQIIFCFSNSSGTTHIHDIQHVLSYCVMSILIMHTAHLIGLIEEIFEKLCLREMVITFFFSFLCKSLFQKQFLQFLAVPILLGHIYCTYVCRLDFPICPDKGTCLLSEHHGLFYKKKKRTAKGQVWCFKHEIGTQVFKDPDLATERCSHAPQYSHILNVLFVLELKFVFQDMTTQIHKTPMYCSMKPDTNLHCRFFQDVFQKDICLPNDIFLG